MKEIKLSHRSFLSKLRIMNLSRCNRWHGKLGVYDWSLIEWAVAVAGECGEMCNWIKKLNRLIRGMQQNAVNLRETEINKKIRKEIGDQIIYLDLLAARCGWRLEDIIRDTFNEVSAREGFPERLL